MAAFTTSRGRVEAVTDDQILDAYRLLAAREGVFCEPASAASVAGILEHGLPVAEGQAAPETVVCVLTGHGRVVGAIGRRVAEVTKPVDDLFR